MLAIAKLGEPAIPEILARANSILSTPDPDSTDITELRALVMVLGSFGPRAIPALLEIAGASRLTWVTFDALQQIVDLEPRSTIYGQDLGPWYVWRPADDRLEQLEQQLVPLLPHVPEILKRAIAEGKPDSLPPQRPAAYLLARWGTGSDRKLGLDVLYGLATTHEPFYNAIDSIKLLHALRAPRSAQLIRQTAPRVPDTTDLKDEYLLRMSIALYQLGDVKYTDLLEWPLQHGRPHIRTEARQFMASTRNIAAELAGSPLLGIDRVPIWEANRLIDELGPHADETSLPLIDTYLRRRDLKASSIGPNTYRGSGGSGPAGVHGPRVVTLLLDMVQRNVIGADERLGLCLQAADPDVRLFGALALSAYDRNRAVEHLAGELRTSDPWRRKKASQFLVQLGDPRGIPALIDALDSDEEFERKLACRDLRVYSQQPLPCDAPDAPVVPRGQAAWRDWWRDNQTSFRLRSREAALDLEAFPSVTSVSFGGPPIR